MPSSYTTSLRLTLPATGELTGTWGTTVNTGITELLDAAVAGTTTISSWGGAGVPYTLSNTDGAADEARRMFIVASGTPGEAKNVICPAVSKLYFFRNDTIGGFALTLKTSGGSGITVPAGQARVLYCNGTNVVEAFNAISSLTLGTALGAGSGGTGQSTYVIGDLLYATGTTALSKLGIGTNGQILTSTGTAPQWSTLSGVAVTTFSGGTTGLTPTPATSGAITLAGTLATTNGGTGLTSFTANGVVYASSTSALTTGSALTFTGATFVNNGSTNVTSFQAVTSTNTAQLQSRPDISYSRVTSSSFLLDLATLSNQPILFTVNSNEQMRLTSTGLGIGTSSPARKLHVAELAAGSGIRISGPSGDNNWAGGIEFYSANATTIASSILVSSNGMLFNYGGSERMRLDSSGNLGIGTNSPGTKLDVKQSGTNWYDGIRVVRSTNDNQRLVFGNTSGASWIASVDAAGGVNNELIFGRSTNGTTFTESGRFDSSGNLVIGSTSAQAKLHVATGNLALSNLGSGLTGSTPAAGTQKLILGGNSSNGVGSEIGWYTNTSFSGDVAQLTAIASAFGSSSAGAMIFRTNSGTQTTPGERMRLDSNGNLGIGTAAPGYRLTVNGAQQNIGGGANTIPALSTTLVSGEINGSLNDATDYGLLRLSAGGRGGTLSTKSAIDLQGFGSTDNSQIRFYTTGSERMRLDASGNLGLGVTPSAWNLGKAVEVGNVGNALWAPGGNQIVISQGAYWNSGWKYSGSSAAAVTYYDQFQGAHRWYTAPSGTAGNAISFTQAMTLTATGELGVGTTNPSGETIDVLAGVKSGQIVASTSTNNGFAAVVAAVRDGGENRRAGLYVDDSNATWGLASKYSTTGADFVLVNNNARAVTANLAGSVIIGSAAIATTATDGFFYIPTCAGAPTGTPTAQTGRAPLVVDSTNNRFYVYVGGAWKYAALV